MTAKDKALLLLSIMDCDTALRVVQETLEMLRDLQAQSFNEGDSKQVKFMLKVKDHIIENCKE